MAKNGTKVRVGLTSARELELEVEDGDAFAAEIEAALSGGGALFWITDVKGHRHGVVTEKVAFVEIEAATDRPGVGFGAIPDVTGG